MSLVRWNPARDLAAWPSDLFGMQREINRMFNNMFRGSEEGEDYTLASWTPAVDIAEHDDEYTVKVELPGVNKDDVKITVESNMLTVRGEKILRITEALTKVLPTLKPPENVTVQVDVDPLSLL